MLRLLCVAAAPSARGKCSPGSRQHSRRSDSAARHPLVRAGGCAETLLESAGQMSLIGEADFCCHGGGFHSLPKQAARAFHAK